MKYHYLLFSFFWRKNNPITAARIPIKLEVVVELVVPVFGNCFLLATFFTSIATFSTGCSELVISEFDSNTGVDPGFSIGEGSGIGVGSGLGIGAGSGVGSGVGSGIGVGVDSSSYS